MFAALPPVKKNIPSEDAHSSFSSKMGSETDFQGHMQFVYKEGQTQLEKFLGRKKRCEGVLPLGGWILYSS